jgi:hypothetical protein
MRFNRKVLASLLPGVRQLRAPLASGYLWLLVAWVALADRVPRSSTARPGIFRDLYEIAATAGRPATAAAVSFAAYLLGVLSVQATQFLTPRLRGLRRRRWAADRLPTALVAPSAAGQQALRDAVLTQFTDRVDSDDDLKTKLEDTSELCGEFRDLDNRDVRRGLLDIRINVDYYLDKLEKDLPLMPLRLLGDDKERNVYSEFDRNRAG